ncbi:MAG: hypothetical protein K6G88_11085 [Lachnospiraceae bacterium]|nr:hypothetical protein [Lachnospiraceae bacterium]
MQNETREKIKSLKTASTCLTVLIIVCVVIVSICVIQANQLKEEQPEVLPDGRLSHSIFELQNNEYNADNDMPIFYYINNGHYSYDMYADVQKADVNDSSFFAIDSDVTLGVTTCENADDSLEVLKRDIEEGFSVKDVEVVQETEGYANGWVAKFYLFVGKSGNADVNGAAYVAQTEEGSFVVSAVGLKDFEWLQECARATYDTVHVTAEWIDNNVEETSQMFISEEESSEEISENVNTENTTEEIIQDTNTDDVEGGN